MPQGTPLQKILSADSIKHWKIDSLYVLGDDADIFYRHDAHILVDAVYSNMKRGPVDLLDINFYSHEQAVSITDYIKNETSPDYQIF